MNRNTKIKLAAIALLTALVCIFTAIRRPPRAPQILDISPNEMIKSAPANAETPIRLTLEYITDTIGVYVNGIKIDGFEILDERTISFLMPELFLDQGDRKIQLVSETGGILKRKSNTVTLSILPETEELYPKISGVSLEKLSDVTALISIEGENYTKSSTVTMNGQIVESATVIDSGGISATLKWPVWGLENELSFVVYDANNEQLRSAVYTIDNTIMIEIPTIYNNTIFLEENYLVAHALGGIDGMAYTNSLEAFEWNYSQGHRLFEIDLQFTADGVLASLHDRETAMDTFEAEALSLLPYTLLSFEDICELMLKYDDFYIVTDTKYHDSFNAIKNAFDYITRAVSESDSDLIDRIIVQVYNQEMYYFLSNLYDFKSYIYTLYYSSDSNTDVVDFVEKTGIPAVAMWVERASPEFVQALKEAGACTFAHTVNDIAQVYSLFEIGVYGVYTDFIVYDDLLQKRDERYASFIGDDENETVNLLIFTDYISRMDNPENTYVIYMSGTNRMLLPEKAEEAFRKLGLALPSASGELDNYLAVLRGGTVLFEKLSQEPVIYTKRNGMTGIDAVFDSRNGASVQIGGVDYGMGLPSVCIITYADEDGLIDAVSFNCAEDYRWDDCLEYLNAREFMSNYLSEVYRGRYIVLMSVKDEGSNAVDKIIQERLESIGLREPLIGKYRYGYAAAINAGEVVFEDCSETAINSSFLVDEWMISITSAGFDAGNVSSIRIDGCEYSMNRRGLNIVILDKTTGYVIDSVCFDTFDQLQFYR